MEIMETIVLNDPEIKDILCIDEKEKILIQLSRKSPIEFYEELNNCLVQKEFTNLEINFRSYDGDFADLEFLKHFSNLKRLRISDYDIRSLQNILYLKNITHLTIMNNNKKLKIDSLKEVVSLEFLEIENVTIVNNFFEKNINLKELVLGSIHSQDFSFLNGIKSLRSLCLYRCNIEDFSILPEMKQLEALALDGLKNISDISFVESFTLLGKLRLYNLPKINQLPTFCNNTKLREIDFSNLPNITRIDNSLCLDSLESFYWEKVNNLVPIDDFSFLIKLKKLQECSIWYNSTKIRKALLEKYPNIELRRSNGIV